MLKNYGVNFQRIYRYQYDIETKTIQNIKNCCENLFNANGTPLLHLNIL
jgi:hypothetical protein